MSRTYDVDLADLIRVNQLVRDRIDIDGFEAWFAVLLPDQRRTLTCRICELAYQAGVTSETWSDALSASGLPASDAVVQRVLAAGQGEHPVFRLYELLAAMPEEHLPTAFRLFVYLFGTAEGAVYRGESPDCCNHWWHRDLLDERVVQDLLSDPRWYMTSLKDDFRIKERA